MENSDLLVLSLRDELRRNGLSGETGTVSALTLLFIRFLELKKSSNYLEGIGKFNSDENWSRIIINESSDNIDKEFENFFIKSVEDLRNLQGESVNQIIDKIRELKTTDSISLAFSFLLERSLGLYQHSPVLNGILSEVLDAKSGRLFAPSFGFGDILCKFQENKENLEFHGNESNLLAFGLARMNLMINGIDGNFKLENCFKTNPDEFIGKFDFAAVVPPFAVRYTSDSVSPEFAKRYGNRRLGDSIWPQIVLDSLKLQGKGVMVLPIGSTFSNRSELREMRRAIISSGYVESIIALPTGMLSYTSVSTAIYVFNKNYKKKDIQFIDARNGIQASIASTVRIPIPVRLRIANEIVMAYRTGLGAKKVSIEEIQAREYNLDPKTYILNLEEKESRKESIKEYLDQIDRELLEQAAVIEKSDDPEEILQSEVRIGRLGTDKESMTIELVEIEGRRAKIDRDNQEHKTSQALKVKAFKMVIIVMSVEIALTYAIFGLVGLKILDFTEISLNIFVGATISQITAIFYWIIKHLFPSSSN